MYFLIFQPEDMLKLCLNFNESQTICAYACGYKKRVHVNVALIKIECMFPVSGIL